METISLGHRGKLYHRVPQERKFGLEWSELDGEEEKKIFVEEEGDLVGTSNGLIDLKGMCFSRWVLDHIYSRGIAFSWLRRVITMNSIISLSIGLQPRIFEIRKVFVVTPGTSGEQKKIMFGTLGRSKAYCAGTIRIALIELWLWYQPTQGPWI